MGRKSHSNYIEAARQVLTELGGGAMASRDLVAAAQERGLVGEGKWVYHNFLRKIRESDEFDTSVRGQVSLFDGAPAPEAEVAKPATPSPGTFPPNEEAAANLEEDGENPFADTTA